MKNFLKNIFSGAASKIGMVNEDELLVSGEDVFKSPKDDENLPRTAASYSVELLFEEKPKLIGSDIVRKKLCERFKSVSDMSGGQEEGLCFVLPHIASNSGEGASAPVKLTVLEGLFDEAAIDEDVRSQFWENGDINRMLSRCRYKIILSDEGAGDWPYNERCAMIADFIGILLELYPDCAALYCPWSRKIVSRDMYTDGEWPDEDLRFLNVGLNIRIFNIKDSEIVLIDTTGFNSIGLPDIQYHFRSVDCNDIVIHVHNLAAYIFRNGAAIEDNAMIDGVNPGEKWPCRMEYSLLRPERYVLNVRVGGV